MTCYVCNNGTLTETRETIQHDALPGVLLAGIRVRHCDSCGERLEAIPAPAKLTRLLAEMLICKRGRLASAEVRFLRKSLSLSGKDLAGKLRMDPSVVSRWENGKETVGWRTEMLLRVLVSMSEPVESFSAELWDQVGVEAVTPFELTIAHTGKWAPALVA